MDEAVIAGIFAIMLALVEVIKILANKVSVKKNGYSSNGISISSRSSRDLFELIRKLDSKVDNIEHHRELTCNNCAFHLKEILKELQNAHRANK